MDIQPILGSHVIEPTQDLTRFLKIGFVVVGSGFYSYHNLQCIKLDKEKRKQEKKWVQSLVGFYSTPTQYWLTCKGDYFSMNMIDFLL